MPRSVPSGITLANGTSTNVPRLGVLSYRAASSFSVVVSI
jgi:hypothetical protein